MINGCLSRTFKITRGVRQGDPLSCLLFDLAIEPLAASLRASSLKGYNIPGAAERLIATLFADDTTTFLHKEDSFADLMSILDTWCTASGAKFNKDKTEIIPLGLPEYRAHLIDTRRPTPDSDPLPDHIHIAKDGEMIRILGAWYGNEINPEAVWTPTLEKVNSALERWERRKPTMAGRKHVVQMVVGGMTQYKAKVQGMPKKVEVTLERKIRTFMWADKTQAPVNTKTLYAPMSQGGLGVLDIVTRNKSIEINWIKGYLTFGAERPLWALVADAILARGISKAEENIPLELRQNVFLQTWTARSSSVPTRLKRSFAAAKDLGLRREGLAFERGILRDMPMWMHGEANDKLRRLNHSKASKCLQSNHNLRTVGDAENIAGGLDNPGHKARSNCACTACKAARRTTTCPNPHACFARATELLDLLPEKWDPRRMQPQDTEVRPHRSRPQPGDEEGEEWTPFDAAITTKGNLSDIFRVFTEGTTMNELYHRPRPTDVTEDIVVATDGSCFHNGQGDAVAGAGGYAGDEHAANFSLRLPAELHQSNQTGEIVAVSETATRTEEALSLHVTSDSRLTINEATTLKEKHEDCGYIGTANAPLIRKMIGNLRQHPEDTYFKWVKGHRGHELNEGADKLAGQGAQKGTPNTLDLMIPATLTVTGAKLGVINQKMAYRAIREREMQSYQKRTRTESNIVAAIDNIESFFGEIPTEQAIWNGIRRKDIRREVRYFLWMTAHDTYMVGSNWRRAGYSPELHERGECKVCGQTESMNHILSECDAPGQKEVWSLARSLWKQRNRKWPRPFLGAVLSCAIAPFKTSKGKPKTGDARLYTILVTESAHLIWKIRNERVIQEDNQPARPPATRREIRARWESTINARLSEDCALTDAGKYGGKALAKSTVERTWSKVLRDEDDLPHDWWRGKTEVLVGINRPRLGDGDASEISWSDDGVS